MEFVYTLLIILLAALAGYIVNFFVTNKVPILALKLGGLGLAAGSLAFVFKLLSAGQVFMVVMLFFCTGLILAELRKEKED